MFDKSRRLGSVPLKNPAVLMRSREMHNLFLFAASIDVMHHLFVHSERKPALLPGAGELCVCYGTFEKADCRGVRVESVDHWRLRLEVGVRFPCGATYFLTFHLAIEWVR